jgi:hypothetical protein
VEAEAAVSSAYTARASLSGAARPIGTLIAVASIALLILPFFSTFGELLTGDERLWMRSRTDGGLGPPGE